MLARDFTFWLQGFFEITEADSGQLELTGLSPEQVTVIRNHLSLVFVHDIDPSMGPAPYQAVLNEVHEGKPMPAIFGGLGPNGEIQRC